MDDITFRHNEIAKKRALLMKLVSIAENSQSQEFFRPCDLKAITQAHEAISEYTTELARISLESKRKKAQRFNRALEVISILKLSFPNAFPSDPNRIRPLAIGIHKAIFNVTRLNLDPREIGDALFHWCNQERYLLTVAMGLPRHNLLGNSLGELPTPEQQNDAKNRIMKRWSRKSK